MNFSHLFLLPGLLMLAACSAVRESPPSRFIGLYGGWNGFPNGALPTPVENFTGRWQTDDGRITGWYRNGIPTGEWISYSPGGRIDAMAVYGPGGVYESMSYFPDGMPRTRMRGRGSFSKSGFELSESETVLWNFDGEVVPSGGKSEIFRYPTLHPQGVQSLEYSIGEDYAVECWYLASGRNFDLVLYLIPRKKCAGSPARIRVKGAVSGKEVTIKSTERFGEAKLQFAEAFLRDDSLGLLFFLGTPQDERNQIMAKLVLVGTDTDATIGEMRN